MGRGMRPWIGRMGDLEKALDGARIGTWGGGMGRNYLDPFCYVETDWFVLWIWPPHSEKVIPA